MRPDELKLTVRKSRQHFPLWTDNMPQMQYFLLNLEQSVERLFIGSLHNLVFQLGDPEGEFIQGRLIVFHDPIQDGICYPIRRPRYVARASQATLLGHVHAFQWQFVIRHQKIPSQKKV